MLPIVIMYYLSVIANNNTHPFRAQEQQFKVHSTILELQGDGIDWSTDPPPFTNLSEEVLGTILHFLYCECLPDNVTEETARQVITIATAHASLSKLVAICQSYLKNITLKQRSKIMGLVNDMHFYMNQIIDRFNSRSSHDSPENPVTNPEKILVQNSRSFAICLQKGKPICLKMNDMEIIHYAKSRLPIFLTQLTRLKAILDTALFTQDVTKSKSSEGDMLSKTLSNLSHIRELTKLNTFHEHITCSLGLLVHKKVGIVFFNKNNELDTGQVTGVGLPDQTFTGQGRFIRQSRHYSVGDNFNQMSPSQKVRSISRNLEQLIDELPVLLIRLEERAAVFDEKLEWRDFKFCFKVGTSRVSDILDKLLLHIDSLQDVMQQVCELVQRDTFTQALQSLDLLTASAFFAYKRCTETKEKPIILDAYTF
ncbi:hypothetical protein NQ317_006950 [Molorchus minor]|uniref:BTB domain-containing protein n=1 Tax=Molorchus minor TaxID=1323400 RepID=A0ABQ9J1X2_9CUCU|nr:hypothetical protein NQ317_006950 [Molorchus minor]